MDKDWRVFRRKRLGCDERLCINGFGNWISEKRTNSPEENRFIFKGMRILTFLSKQKSRSPRVANNFIRVIKIIDDG